MPRSDGICPGEAIQTEFHDPCFLRAELTSGAGSLSKAGVVMRGSLGHVSSRVIRASTTRYLFSAVDAI